MQIAKAAVLVPMLMLPVACGSSSQTEASAGGTTGATSSGGQTGSGGSGTGGATSGSTSGGSGANSIAGPSSLTFNVAFAGYSYADPNGGGPAKDGGYGLVVVLSEQDLTPQCSPVSALAIQPNKRLVCLIVSAGAGASVAPSEIGQFTQTPQDYQQYYSDEWSPGVGLFADVGGSGHIVEAATATSGTLTFNDTTAPLEGSFMAQMADSSHASLGQLTGNFTATYCPTLAYGCALPNPQ